MDLNAVFFSLKIGKIRYFAIWYHHVYHTEHGPEKEMKLLSKEIRKKM